MIIPKGTVVTIDGKVYRTLEAQVAWNKEELESLDIEALEALPDQFTELQENVSALGDSVADVVEDVGDLESDMSDAQSDISGLKDRMDSAESDIDQLQFDVDQAEGDISGLGLTKLDKPTNTGDVGDVLVKTASGSEWALPSGGDSLYQHNIALSYGGFTDYAVFQIISKSSEKFTFATLLSFLRDNGIDGTDGYKKLWCSYVCVSSSRDCGCVYAPDSTHITIQNRSGSSSNNSSGDVWDTVSSI